MSAALLARRATAPLADALSRLQMDLRAGAGDIATDVDHLVTGTRHLGEVVEDLLLSTQLHRRDDARTPVELGVVAADVIADQITRAQQQDVALTLVPDAAGPSVVSGHEAALRRVLTALVDNALSHTPPGGHVSVELGTDHDMVTVVVRDDGTGFDPADAEHLFDRFAHGGHDDHRRFGLGLSLAREVVTGHGGRIDASGHPGQGATFTVRLPAAGR